MRPRIGLRSHFRDAGSGAEPRFWNHQTRHLRQMPVKSTYRIAGLQCGMCHLFRFLLFHGREVSLRIKNIRVMLEPMVTPMVWIASPIPLSTAKNLGEVAK
jgi:hypothetical protein